MSERTKQSNGTATLHFTPVGSDQAYVSAVIETCTDARQAANDAYGKLADLLAEGGWQIVHERVFGSLESHATVLEARAAVLGQRGIATNTPVTYLEGRPLWGRGLAGASFMLVRPAAPSSVWTVADEAGRSCGRAWKRDGATFLFLQNLHGRVGENGADNSQPAQAGRMFDRAAQILRGQNVDYRGVTRTWLYLSNILGWYGEFNKVRSAKYSLFGLMPRAESSNGKGILLPASTGIEGSAPTGAAATLDLLATILEPGSPVTIRQMSNPKQKDAFRYGSAFSRGAAIRLPEATWISISGTAAIDDRGVSLYPGDFRRQTHATLDTIEALIAQEGARLTDLCDATIFLKRAEDAQACREALAERGLKDLPGVPMLADVCREELLFEMDGAAVAQGPR